VRYLILHRRQSTLLKTRRDQQVPVNSIRGRVKTARQSAAGIVGERDGRMGLVVGRERVAAESRPHGGSHPNTARRMVLYIGLRAADSQTGRDSDRTTAVHVRHRSKRSEEQSKEPCVQVGKWQNTCLPHRTSGHRSSILPSTFPITVSPSLLRSENICKLMILCKLFMSSLQHFYFYFLAILLHYYQITYIFMFYYSCKTRSVGLKVMVKSHCRLCSLSLMGGPVH